jgi:hypothetical protein
MTKVCFRRHGLYKYPEVRVGRVLVVSVSLLRFQEIVIRFGGLASGGQSKLILFSYLQSVISARQTFKVNATDYDGPDSLRMRLTPVMTPVCMH